MSILSQAFYELCLIFKRIKYRPVIYRPWWFLVMKFCTVVKNKNMNPNMPKKNSKKLNSLPFWFFLFAWQNFSKILVEYPKTVSKGFIHFLYITRKLNISSFRPLKNQLGQGSWKYFISVQRLCLISTKIVKISQATALFHLATAFVFQ